MMIKRLMLSAIMLIASAGTQAVEYDIGTLPTDYTGFGPYTVSGSTLAVSGSFLDKINFSMADTPIFNISDLRPLQFDNAITITILDSGLNGGGIYAGGLQVSAVPEQNVWILLMSGLAMIGFMAYRRRDMH